MKEMEGIKKKQIKVLEPNYTVTKIKISLDGINSRMEKSVNLKIEQ